MAFYSESLFIFYIRFEMSVIPIFLVVLGWGYQPDRIEAGIYILRYTVFFSLPLLIKILSLKYLNQLSFIRFMGFIIAFLVKIPIVGFHF